MTTVFIPREDRSGETRVAAVPETVQRMIKADFAVTVAPGAGLAAGHGDEKYKDAGATIADDGWSAADVVLTVRPPSLENAGKLKEGALLIGFLAPYGSLDLARLLNQRKVSSLAMELVPRVTRAQPMDALSSQASIAGYKAVLLAANHLPKYIPLLMTAAGTIAPARMVIMGAGVAGLQAIATARRLGAVVEVSDIRPAVKEQVESLGGKFIELPMAESGEGQGGYAKEMSEDFLRKQREIVARHVANADVVITTALVPGRPAPKLVGADMVAAMKRGAVVVDLAIEQGGNCELSKADEEVDANGVKVLAPSNLVATVAGDASLLYARNVLSLLMLGKAKDGSFAVRREDEVVEGCLWTHGGEAIHPAIAERLKAG
jgi:NAD(P) transhydrogenase subunit alpha